MKDSKKYMKLIGKTTKESGEIIGNALKTIHQVQVKVEDTQQNTNVIGECNE